MPAEYIRGCQPVIGTPDDVKVEGLVGVIWHDDLDHVQVATLTRKAVTHETIDSIYIDLDRRGLNDLVRHLRRARNKAYGEDA